MPANLFSSSALLSGTVLVMLLAWLFCSAAMTLRVGMKNRRAENAVAPPQEPPGRLNEPESAEQIDQPAPAGGALGEAKMMITLGFSQGQRASGHADPEMVSLAASADS